MKPVSLYRCKSEVVFKKEGKEALLFNSRTGTVNIINETGIIIWLKCAKGSSEDDIVKKLLNRYAAVESKVRSQTRRFLKIMCKEKLLEFAR